MDNALPYYFKMYQSVQLNIRGCHIFHSFSPCMIIALQIAAFYQAFQLIDLIKHPHFAYLYLRVRLPRIKEQTDSTIQLPTVQIKATSQNSK